MAGTHWHVSLLLCRATKHIRKHVAAGMEATCSIEIIEKILKHLEDPFDLISCSAVSHKWHSGYLNARISDLSLSTSSTDLSTAFKEGNRKSLVSGLIHWIQARHVGGNFCQLTGLTAFVDDDGENTEDLREMLWLFSGVLLALASYWPLQRVALCGYFDLNTAPVLLPASVQHMQLGPIPRTLPKVVDLGVFCKFKALQHLEIMPFGADPLYQPKNCFLLSAALASLTYLTLASWPLLLKDGCTIAGNLPSLQCASLCVHIDFVNAFTSLDQFKVLEFVLMDEPDETADPVFVGASSQLSKLVLRGPVQTVMQLVAQKPGLQLLCQDLSFSKMLVAS